MIAKVINVDMIKNPYNWIIVVIMCVFALIFMSLLFPQDAPPAA